MASRYIRSNILGFIAIFIALGGVGVAAGLKKNSVTSKQIKDGQVKSVDVADNGLTGTDINEGTLSGLPQGPATPTGPAGGDLTGTYPNPTVASNAIGSTEVTDNSLLGTDIDETSLDNTILQSRVTGTCGAGSSIRVVAQNGNVTCEPDSDTIAPGGSAGGDLTGTYPNPTISGNSVGAAEVVNATDALGLRRADIGIGGGLFNVDFPSQNAGTCSLRTITGITGAQNSDLVIANPRSSPELMAIPLDVANADQVDFFVCNPTASAINPVSIQWRILLIR